MLEMGGRTRGALAGSLIALTLLAPAAARAQSVEPRIIGGTTASISQFPWQVALVYDSRFAAQLGNPHNRELCGGSVITASIVITAAHCAYDTDPDCGPNALQGKPAVCTILIDPGGDGTKKLDANDVNVVLGQTTLSTATESEVLPQAGAVSYQANFNINTFRNDVGYVVLQSPTAQSAIDIAGSDEASLWDAGSFEDISGWGSTSETSGTVDTLRAGSVPVVDDATCGSSTDYGNDFDPATMVCAGYVNGGVDTCYGDSGGPLEAPLEGGGYRLVGLTGWGEGCAEPNKPGVYTRVAEPALRDAIVAKAASLETTFSLTHEDIVGTGGQPRSGGPTYPPPPSPSGATATTQPVSAPSAAPADPFAKCRRVRSKKKRGRCVKKVRAQLQRQ
jgi:secreted trypsin-like serine protease